MNDKELRHHVEQRLCGIEPIDSDLPTVERGTTSTHEAGHAVIQIDSGPGVDYIQGKVEARTVPVGGVEAYLATNPRSVLTCAVAGPVAERLHGEVDVSVKSADRATAAAALDCIKDVDDDPPSDEALLDAAIDQAVAVLTLQRDAVSAIAKGHGGRPDGKPWDGVEIHRLAIEVWREVDE